MKKALFALAATSALIASPAAAEVFTYTQPNGNVLTIDTDNQSGSITGPGRDIKFTSPSFANFKGGPNPSGHFSINIDPSSTVTSGFQINTFKKIGFDGTVYSPSKLHMEKLKFEGAGRYSLWATWDGSNGIRLGDEYFNYNGFATTPSGSSTSTSTGGVSTSTSSTTSTSTSTGGVSTSTSGGSTTGGVSTSTSGGSTTGGASSTSGGSSTGGTSVPAPGVLGLMGLALAAIGLGRRRRRSAAA